MNLVDIQNIGLVGVVEFVADQVALNAVLARHDVQRNVEQLFFVIRTTLELVIVAVEVGRVLEEHRQFVGNQPAVHVVDRVLVGVVGSGILGDVASAVDNLLAQVIGIEPDVLEINAARNVTCAHGPDAAVAHLDRIEHRLVVGADLLAEDRFQRTARLEVDQSGVEGGLHHPGRPQHGIRRRHFTLDAVQILGLLPEASLSGTKSV